MSTVTASDPGAPAVSRGCQPASYGARGASGGEGAEEGRWPRTVVANARGVDNLDCRRQLVRVDPMIT